MKTSMLISLYALILFGLACNYDFSIFPQNPKTPASFGGWATYAVVMQPDGTFQQRVTPRKEATYATQPIWFPDSKHVAYHLQGEGIFCVDVDNPSDDALMTNWDPNWDPNLDPYWAMTAEDRLVLSSTGNYMLLFGRAYLSGILDIRAGTIVDASELGLVSHVSFSHGGDRFVFAQGSEYAPSDVLTLVDIGDAMSKEAISTGVPGFIHDPQFMPDDSSIVFAANDTFYSIRTDGTGCIRIMNIPGFLGSFRLSTSGKKIVCQAAFPDSTGSYVGGRWIMNLDGTALFPLEGRYYNLGGRLLPSFSPDESKVFWVDDNGNIIVSNLKGQMISWISPQSGAASSRPERFNSVSISPDGTRLLAVCEWSF